MLQNLALFKLTGSLFEKAKGAMNAKKDQWAKDAPLSVEENKRRVAEFKEDFSKLKKSIGESFQKVREVTAHKVEALQIKGVKAADVVKKSTKETKTVAEEAKTVVEKSTPKRSVKKTAPAEKKPKVVKTETTAKKEPAKRASKPKTTAKKTTTATKKPVAKAKKKVVKTVKKDVKKS